MLNVTFASHLLLLDLNMIGTPLVRIATGNWLDVEMLCILTLLQPMQTSRAR